MLFNTFTFLLLHALAVLLYWTTPWTRVRQATLLLSSTIFYGWLYWPGLLLLAASIIVNYLFSRWIDTSPVKKKTILLRVAIVLNLASLAWFKYAAFIAENLVAFLGAVGISAQTPTMSAWLPLGISFYTFQIIGYLIDISRGQIRAERNFLAFGVFTCFYAQLIAGPIVRAHELLPQLKTRQNFDSRNLHLGIYLILAGLAIKICVADTLAQFVDHGFADPEQLGWLTAWLTLYGFAFQILSDFWGYSTIAIGLGLMYGIKLPLNFNLPYAADSIRNFWRRWHITLSEWLRDYLYIPLGGNRKAMNRNLFLTMLLGGLWHGASWNFIIWGAGHGIWLVLERLTPKVFPDRRAFHWLKIFLVFQGVCLLWIFFRSPDISTASSYLSALFAPSLSTQASPPETLVYILLAFVTFMLMLGKSLTDRRFLDWSLTRQVGVCLMLLALINAYADANLDFIYFEF
jgi:D-alanyl-lipoteichoic acid acyltransferase DltB (MBOAT superfamily)